MDVTGHGMKAATTTFLANGMLRSESKYGNSPGEIMSKMHQRLQEALSPQKTYVAASFALINTDDKKLTHFNAGIPKPVLLRDGKPVELSIPSSLPLGCPLPGEYMGSVVSLCSGDVLLFFSDGLTEAEDANGNMYQYHRMGSLLNELSQKQLSAQKWLDEIVADVRRYTASREPEDDLTLIVLIVN